MNTERFRQQREKRGLTKRELAKLCEMREMQILRYEAGTNDPSTENLKILAHALEVSADYLLGMTDTPRGYYGDALLEEEEHAILDAYRRDGWPGIIKLGADQLIQKKNRSPD